jgi:hypothetical protein
MVLDETAGSHAIDFLNPRKKPEEKSSRLSYILAAAAALLGLGWYAWWQYDRISEKRLAVQALNLQIQAEKDETKKLQPIVERTAKFDSWLASDMPWLDKLYNLSHALRGVPLDAKDFPTEKDVVVTSLTLASAEGGGRATFDLAATDHRLALEIEKRIREMGGTMTAETAFEEEETRPGYKWTLPGATVHVTDQAK